MLDVEPWQLFPLPPEQVGKIRSYIARREQIVAERAVRNLTVYVAMIADRHADPEPYVFSTPEAAIAYARSQAAEFAHDPDDIDESHLPKGWLYHATYSVEGDSVWVIEKELDGSTE